MSSKKVNAGPDSGVADAIQSVLTNHKFKRMLIFGLRSLSDFCVLPTIKYKENAASVAQNSEAVTALLSALETYKGDDEVTLLIGKIFLGITEAARMDPTIQQIVLASALPSAVQNCMIASIPDPGCFEIYLNILKNLQAIKAPLQEDKIAPSLLAVLSPKSRDPLTLNVLNALEDAVNDNNAALAVADASGIEKILKAIVHRTSSPAMVTVGLNACGKVAKASHTPSMGVDMVIEIMEAYRDTQTVQNAGSNALAQMVSVDDLKKCLETLKNSPPTSPERADALTTLSSMSYIASCASEVVKVGGVALLVEAVSQAAAQIVTKPDPKTLKGLVGACKMLQAVESSSDQKMRVAEAGGLDAFVRALSALASMKDVPAAVSAALEAVAPLITIEPYSSNFAAGAGLPAVLKLLDLYKESSVVLASCTRVIAALASKESCVAALNKAHVVRALGKIATSKAVVSNKQFKINYLTALKCLALSNCDNDEVITSAPPTAFLTLTEAGSADVADIGCECLLAMSRLTTPEHMSGAVDTALAVMLEHTDTNPQVACRARDILNTLASEKDVAKTLSELESALNGARQNSARCMRCLAAVNGLSQVSHLKGSFERQDAATTIAKGMSKWIDSTGGAKFPEQQKLIKVACHCIESLVIGASSANLVDKLLKLVIETIQMPALKTLSQRQADAMDNSLVDACNVMESLTSTHRFGSATDVNEHIEGILRVMRKYPDARRPQVHCINALTHLVEYDQEAPLKVIQAGGLKAVLNYMGKVTMYEDVQIASCKFMLALARDAKALDHLKAQDQAAKNISKGTRMHRNSLELTQYARSVMSLLVPEGEIERIIMEGIRTIDQGVKKGDWKSVAEALRDINGATASPGAPSIAAKCNLGKAIHLVANACSSPDVANMVGVSDCQAEAAIAAGNLCQKHIGVVHMTKVGGGVSSMVKLWEGLLTKKPLDNPQAIKSLLNGIKRCVQKDRLQADILFKKGFVTQACKFAEEYEEDDDLFAAAVGAMAALKPAKTLLKHEDFRRFIGNLCEKLLREGPINKKWPLIEALDELLLDPCDEIIEIVLKNKGLAGVYKCMDDFPENDALVNACQRIVANVASKQNLRTAIKSLPDAPLERVCKVTKKVLRNKNVTADTATITLNNLNKIVTSADKQLLADVDLLPEIERLMQTHPLHEPLLKACGEYLGKVGCDELVLNLMRNIIDTCTKQPPDWQKTVEKLNNRLALYLVGEISNPAKALGLTQECMDNLAKLVSNNAKTPNAPLMTSICKVTRRIARRSRDNPDDAYGIPTLKAKMMPALAELLASNGADPKLRPRQLLIDGFHCLADIARFPGTNVDCLQQCMEFGTVQHAEELLKIHSEDPEVCAALLDFLAALCSQPDSAKKVMATLQKPGKRNIGAPEVVESTINMMKRFRRGHPELLDAGFDLLANLAAACGTDLPTLATADTINELDHLMRDEPSTFPNAMKVHSRLVGKVDPSVSVMALTKAQAAYKALLCDPNVPDACKAAAGAALANFVTAMAEAGLHEELRKANGIDTILDLTENHPRDVNALRRTLPAMRAMAENDADANAILARNGVKALLAVPEGVLSGDFIAAKETLKLLNALASPEGQGRMLAQAEGLNGLLAAIHDLAGSLPEHEGQELLCLEKSFRQKVADDQPENLSLEKVHGHWGKAKEGEEFLNLDQSSVVIRYWDYVVEYTEEYSKEPVDSIESGVGREFKFGCLCFRLLHETPENTTGMLAKNEPAIFLRAMAKQKNDHAAQHAVRVALAALEDTKAVEHWAASSNAPAIVGDTLGRGRKMQVSEQELEEMLVERLQLVEKLAVARTYYNGTDTMSALIGIWDDFDKGKYSIMTLKAVFQAMRKIVNDHWVGIVLQNRVPKRLIDIVSDKQANLLILPDVLFLLAALAVVPEIKTMIGELKGVELCLDLLSRSFKDPRPMSAVQTNDCLALSAITLGHFGNLSRFLQSKGVELNIQAMGQSVAGALDYDVANAASVLMCNTCFKRDELKEVYGKKGACQMIMRTINKYDGTEDPKAFRCLGTMFKAIGNLALYTPNVTLFLEGKIEQTFAHLYAKSGTIPDALVEASLRTLSNLTMENTQENMVRFAVCMTPILGMLQQGQRTSITMFTLAFDVLGQLCRLPANSKKFLEQDGIPVCLRILNTYNDPYLYANGIHVLGIQTTTPASVAELIKHGVFNFLASLLGQQANADEESASQDLCISGLRCIRRLLSGKTEANEFIASGGLEQVIHLMQSLPIEASMAHLECHRVILNLLHLFPPPPSQRVRANVKTEEDWDGEVADEGVRTTAETVERPMGPRAWECLQLQPQRICAINKAIVPVLMPEHNLKQIRLVKTSIGILAYFACEKIPGTLSSYYESNIGTCLERLFEFAEPDPNVLMSACHILNNIAFVSEPEEYIKLRKERQMRKNLDIAGTKISGEPRTFCDLTLKLLNEKSADPSRFEINAHWTYPLTLTEWDRDKYPMGVQDLPPEMKEELRAGGKFKTIVKDKEREVIHWRSSMDLTMLQWRIDPKEGPFTDTIAVSRICSIARGLRSDTLINANQNGSATSKPRDYESIVLRGLPCEEFPNGAEINILCLTKRARDKFFELMSEWREAAAYGF